jgi:hypothetical protein
MAPREPVDPRSTWRKRARRVLELTGRPYWCDLEGGNGCGRSPTDENAPGGHYPGMGALQANHKSKVLSDIDPANLEWLCPSCHKKVDSLTEKGVSLYGDTWGYGLPGV